MQNDLTQLAPATYMPQRIVVIGGGTGSSTVLAGLRDIARDGLTAVVNTFDDGGATGRLRREFADLQAVGDLRQCLMAMSDVPLEVKELFDYRFPAGSEEGDIKLHGQTLGNLVVTAASQKHTTLSKALEVVAELYHIMGTVVPVSNDNRRLSIKLADGTLIEGEHTAEETDIPSFKGATILFDQPDTTISDEARQAIEAADIVVIAPGDLYTSIGPVLAVKGMKQALEQAKSVFMIGNLMNRSRHTQGFSLLDYVEEYNRIIGAKVIDRIIYNTQPLNSEALKQQQSIGSQPVLPDIEGLEAQGYVVIGRNLLSEKKVIIDPNDAIGDTRSIIKHDPPKIGAAIAGVYLNNGFANKHKK